MHLVLLGAPGSGKGTQASLMVKDLGYAHVSTGDLLRNEIKKGSKLGNKVSDVIKAGKLVDDALVLELLKANCDLSKNKYIFDGFPRNIDQARALEAEVLSSHFSRAIYFELDLEVLKDRLINRRMCKDCGEIYNLITKNPAVQGKCDSCGSENLYQRDDDKEETVGKRLDVFKETVDPVLDFYKETDRLFAVDASQEASSVFRAIEKAVKA